jgi:hypothetical protein
MAANFLMLVGSLASLTWASDDPFRILGPATLTLAATAFVLMGFEQRRSLERIRALEGRLQEAELQNRRYKERDLLRNANAHELRPSRSPKIETQMGGDQNARMG